MPSANAGASDAKRIPPDLLADHREFARAVRPWLESAVPAERVEPVFDLLSLYGVLVREHAARVSLIARGDHSVIYTRHVLDSLNLATCIEKAPASLLDVGSGAGFPGIPLAIVWPSTRVVLLESRDRKAGFLEYAVRGLGLSNTRVICDRLERVSEERSIGPVDAATIRAVGGLPQVLELLRPLAGADAWWAYFLGASMAEGDPTRDLGPFGGGARLLEGKFGGRILRGGFGP